MNYFLNSSTLEKELKSEKEQRQTLQRELHQEKDATTLLKTELQQMEGLKKVRVVLMCPVFRIKADLEPVQSLHL